MSISKVLVVSAHPLANSLCQHLSAQAREALLGHEIAAKHLNLYASNFDPRLQKEERQSYYQPQFDSNKLETEITQLKETELLVLVFPTWWFGFPAILKGWFDRVWAPGIAYDHATDLSAIKPRLDKLKQVIAITTMGSPWWVDWLIMRRPVRRVLKTALVGVCAPRANFQMLTLYNAEKKTKPQIQEFEARVQLAINTALR